MTDVKELVRPIIGIENRTAQEVFDIMCDRLRRAALSGTREAVEPVGEYPRGTVWFGYDENTGEFTGTSCSVKPHDTRGMRAYAPIAAAPPSDPVGQGVVTDAMAELDAALCNFLNGAADEYDPRVWVPETKRNFERLSKAYDAAYSVGCFPDKLSAISPAPEAGSGEVERLRAERERLALAICGGEDAPGFANAQTVETLERVARDSNSLHMRTLDEATALRDQLGKMRETLGALLDAETVSVHVGYDNGPGGGNFLYVDAVRTDDPAFLNARRALSDAAKGGQ